MERERIIEMYINSNLDRIESENDSTSRSFTVSLQNKNKQIEVLPNERELLVKCFKLEIPNVLYNFPEKESRLFFEVDPDGVSDVKSIQIDTERVYASPSDIVDEVNLKLSQDASLTDISLSYDGNTKKCTLTNNGSQDIRLISSYRYASVESILTFQDMNDRLGFSQLLTETNGLMTPSSPTLEGQGTIRMNRTNNYHLTLEQQSGYYTQSITPADNKNHRVIASVSVGAFGTLSSFSYVSSFGFHLPTGQPLTQLTFSLRDDEFVPVDLVNHPITMALQFIVK